MNQKSTALNNISVAMLCSLISACFCSLFLQQIQHTAHIFSREKYIFCKLTIFSSKISGNFRGFLQNFCYFFINSLCVFLFCAYFIFSYSLWRYAHTIPYLIAFNFHKHKIPYPLKNIQTRIYRFPRSTGEVYNRSDFNNE